MKTLPNQLIAHLNEVNDFVASGELQRKLWPKYNKWGVAKGYHSPRACVRRLQELQNDGTLEVTYRSNHAYYRVKNGAPKQTTIYQTATHILLNGEWREKELARPQITQ